MERYADDDLADHLTDIRTRLAELQMILGPHRAELRWMQEDLTKRCVRLNHQDSVVVSWRAPTAAEIGAIDAARRAFLITYAYEIAEEKRLKEDGKATETAIERIRREKRQVAARRASAPQPKGRSDRDCRQGKLI